MSELTQLLNAIDRKDRNYWDNLTDEERKKFSGYLALRWSASVEGSADFQEWYLRAANERFNRDFFELNHHPKLQWLLATTVSPGMGTHRHYWQGSKSSDKKDNKIRRFAQKCFPNLKNDDIEVLVLKNDINDWRELAKSQGMSDREIKQELG